MLALVGRLFLHHRDTESAENAQRRSGASTFPWLVFDLPPDRNIMASNRFNLIEEAWLRFEAAGAKMTRTGLLR